MGVVYLIGLALGLYMIWGGATRATSKPYFYLHARARILWKDKAHQFLLVSGVLVSLVMAVLAVTR